LIAEEIFRFYVIFGLVIISTGKADFLELHSSALSLRREQHINKKNTATASSKNTNDPNAAQKKISI